MQVDIAFGHWLAGFIDAEGCFGIYRNGIFAGQQTYRCKFSLSLRQDQLTTLWLIREQTGLGNVSVIKRSKGHPECEWRLTSKRDCIGLANLLQTFPLRAKKARDATIWCSALSLWDGFAGRDNAWEQLEQCRRRLTQTRAFVSNPIMPRSTDYGFNQWLGGWIEGEGSFGIARASRGGYRCDLQLRARADELCIMREIVERTGLGRIYHQAAYATSAPRCCWHVYAKRDALALRDLIDRGEILLWGPKKTDFVTWSQACDRWEAIGGTTHPADWAEISALRDDLIADRRYAEK